MEIDESSGTTIVDLRLMHESAVFPSTGHEGHEIVVAPPGLITFQYSHLTTQ